MSSSHGAKADERSEKQVKPASTARTRCLATSVWTIMMLAPSMVGAVSNSIQELVDAAHSKASADRGAKLYQPCIRCHGADGRGLSNGIVPRIGGQHAGVVEKELVDYRHNHRWDPRMEALSNKHHLNDAQAIADVAAYISQLEPGEPSGHGSGDSLVHGAESYASACARCHGGAAEGDAAHAIPELAGQHYEYLRRQIYDAVDGRRPNFSHAHVRLLARLDHEDIEAICDYLSRLNGGGAAPRSGRSPSM